MNKIAGDFFDHNGTEKLRDYYDVWDGVPVLGNLSSILEICTKGGGGIVYNPLFSQVTNASLYVCATLPGSSTKQVLNAFYEADDDASDWFMIGSYWSSPQMMARCNKTASFAAALIPATSAKLGAWCFIPLLASAALAVI